MCQVLGYRDDGVVSVLMEGTSQVSGTGQVETTDSMAYHQQHGVTT